MDPLTQARAASVGAYHEGVVSLVEVLQADENLLRASHMQAQARTESAHAAAALFLALGTRDRMSWNDVSAAKAQSQAARPTRPCQVLGRLSPLLAVVA